MPGKVFGIGLPKTGTTSLYVALSMLGYRAATFKQMRTVGMQSWFAGDFSHDYLQDVDAVTDLPFSAWYREMDARYPGSRFILSDMN